MVATIIITDRWRDVMTGAHTIKNLWRIAILPVFVTNDLTLLVNNWNVGWYRRRNHPCQILRQSVEGFRSSDTPNFVILHRFRWSPLQQCEHCRATLWYRRKETTFIKLHRQKKQWGKNGKAVIGVFNEKKYTLRHIRDVCDTWECMCHCHMRGENSIGVSLIFCSQAEIYSFYCTLKMAGLRKPQSSQGHGWADRQTDRQTDKEKDTQSDGQTELREHTTR